MGRPSKYEKEIKPHIEEIRKAVEAGATVKEIAKAFGISESTLHKYKAEKKEFSDAFARGREIVIIDIKAALLKKALGFNYEEKKQYITEGANGDKKKHTEITTRYCPPSETAAAMLLRNYDEGWNDNDQQSIDLKRQEMELRKAIAESNNFDLDIRGVNDE